VFFAIIAGMAAFGASGLFIGPLIVTFALTLVRIYKRDFKPEVTPGGDDVNAAPPAVDPRTRGLGSGAPMR
jgi:predicted PurR-regulated permease PerM